MGVIRGWGGAADAGPRSPGRSARIIQERGGPAIRRPRGTKAAGALGRQGAGGAGMAGAGAPACPSGSLKKRKNSESGLSTSFVRSGRRLDT